MAFSNADMSAGSDQITAFANGGHAGHPAYGFRLDAYEMKQEDFHKFVQEIRSTEQKSAAAGESTGIGNGGRTVCVSTDDTSASTTGNTRAFARNDVKARDMFSSNLQDPLTGCFVEQAIVPELPQLNKSQQKVLIAFDDAIRLHDPQRIEDLLVSYRGRAKELGPIMDCLAAELSRSGIGLRYTTGNMGVGAAGDMQETGYLDLWDMHGGPVVDFVGHPKFKPQIDIEAVKGKDGILNFYQRKRGAYLDDKDTLMSEVHKTMRSFADKMLD
jgi:hypothetical protein